MRKIKKLRIKKIKHFPGIVLGIALLALLTYVLGWSTLLAAQSVAIDGTDRTDEVKAQILGTSSTFKIGEPLARVDVHSLTRRIARLDWVEKQSVKRDWLHGRLHIVIQERTPIAQFVDENGQIKLIDKTGGIFNSRGSANYPVISFRQIDKELVAAAALYVEQLPSDLMHNAKSFTVNSLNSIQSTHIGLINGLTNGLTNGLATGMTKNEIIVRWGSNSEMETKVKVLRALLALPENKGARIIDLSSPLAPIVK